MIMNHYLIVLNLYKLLQLCQKYARNYINMTIAQLLHCSVLSLSPCISQ